MAPLYIQPVDQIPPPAADVAPRRAPPEYHISDNIKTLEQKFHVSFGKFTILDFFRLDYITLVNLRKSKHKALGSGVLTIEYLNYKITPFKNVIS